ncbi:hypothetical protein GH714_020153 [Hevea brasiliensis]|uniref:Disease resistance protein At4g27190-like leucine-rich repeats domain-containing protein n=1 Tax=Hevea brasiliensis TaxID=3981 RepID=A0A6A6M2Y1_HEVBR|nr:hypothetical protein GH714_020153 [Hevea brasiliensis]
MCARMGAQKVLELEVLREEEAWNLFKFTVSVADGQEPKLPSLATEIAKKCAGLPLLIRKVAADLQMKESYMWDDKLKQLSDLDNEEIQNKSNIQIQNLLKYGMGVGLFKHIATVEEARNKVYTLIDELKAECLLLDGDMNGYVKMHDIVRDTALLIASKEQHIFIGTSGAGLGELPTKDCTRISIPYCDIQALPEGMECPKADLLSVSLKIFLCFVEWEAEAISNQGNASLAELEGLSHLRTLEIQVVDAKIYQKPCSSMDCRAHQMGSYPPAFPILESLFLENLMNLETICHGQLARGSFSKLRTLEVEKCQRLEAMIIDESEYNNEVVEFNQLRSLKLNDLPNLRSFCWKRKVATGTEARQKQLTACPLEEIVSEDELGAELSLFNRMCLQELRISECSALVTFVAKADTKRNTEIQSLFDEMVSFSKLEVLSIQSMNNLKNIWHNQLAADSFCKLKSLTITGCSSLMTVFPLAVLERFQRLEKLDLQLCYSVQEIYQLQGYNVKEVNVAAAFELRDLLIHCCHSLKHIWSKDPQGVFTLQNLKSVHVRRTCWGEEHAIARILTRVKSLELGYLDNLKCIWNQDSRVQPLLQCLQTLKVSDCDSLINVAPSSSSFLSLTTLEVDSCGRLKNLIMASTAKTMVQLSKMIIQYCKMMTEIVASDGDHNENEIIFCKLKYLELSGLSSLTSFCTGNHVFNFPSLEIVIVERCFRMKKFSGGSLITPKLRGIRLNKYADKQHWEGNLNATIACQLTNMQVGTDFRVSQFPELWNGKIQGKLFHNVESLTVDTCTFTSNAIPAHLLQFLNKLRQINVTDSDSLEVVFDLEGLSSDNGHVGLLPRLSELKLMNLPMLRQLWNKHPHGILDFKNLRLLQIENCSSLKYIFTGSMALCLSQLQEVELKYCNMMEGIIEVGKCQRLEAMIIDESEYNNEVVEFNQLRYLKLNDLPNLRSFCWKSKVATVTEARQKQLTACPLEEIVSEDELGAELSLFNRTVSFSKLEKLDLWACDSVQEIYQLQGYNVKEVNVAAAFELRDLRIYGCDSLKHIWSKDPQGVFLGKLWNKHPHGILDFKNLRLLQIENCSSLKYIFTGSMALCLSQLQELELKYCNMMEGIIEVEEANKMIFPSLKSMILECLPKFSNFCSRSSNLECPSLKKMSIYDCRSMKTFFSTLLREQKPKGNGEGREQRQDKEEFDVPFSHKMFPKLEELSLDSKSFKMLLQSEFPTEFFSKLKVVELRFFPGKSCASLFRFLPKLPNLEELGVRDSSLKELFVLKGLGGDQKDTIAPSRIRALKLSNLGDLINLAPSSATFQNLTTLKVSNCNGLKNMVTSTAAKSMVLLETLTVKSCDMLMDIVRGEHRETTEEIVFTKLKTLRLKDLQSFTSFCLGSYALKFPSLEQVTVHGCPNLRIFSPGVLSTPKLQSVKVAWRKFLWERDLNATIEHLYEKAIGFERISHVKFSDFPMLKENWNCEFPFKRMGNLESLVVDECAFFSNAISSNLLKHVGEKLEELAVERCDSVEEVFDLEGLNADEGHLGLTRKLNELRLIDLPRLRHVWNKDPQGFLSFKNLKLLQVHNCSYLANIFTLSMALGLVNLQHMEVKRCRMVEHIIRKEADYEIGRDRTIFPSLHSISIECLPNLSCFYSARDVLKCPSLKKIDVVDCPKMELLASASRYEQDSSVIVEGSEESVYKGDVAIPSLEELKVEWKTMKDMWPEKFQSIFLSGLKGIELTCYPGRCALLPTDFFQILTNLEKLVLRDASFEEKTFHEANIGEQVHPESCKVPVLKHLMEKDSQQVPASQYLETEAMDCGRLKILLPFTVSLENLTTLEVSNCQGLINLMTSITCRSLVQLRRMKVEKCEMMQEIVASETDDEEEEICFSQLQYLELHDLPRLTSFCSANPAFNFPSLEEVIIRACPNMKIFAKEVLSTPKLWRVQTGKHKYEWEWEGSINNTIEALFTHTEEVLDMEDEDQQRHANALDVVGWDSCIYALALERVPASSRIPCGNPVLVNQVRCSFYSCIQT